MNTQNQHYIARCFCGSVELKLSGTPELMAYCHCDSCRTWSAGPVSRFTLWRPESIEVIKGKDQLRSHDKNSAQNGGEVISERTWCAKCGGHVYTHHPTMGMTDVPAVLISGLNFEPAFHVHYQESVFPIKDGLPKFKDLPEPVGGSGATQDE